MAKLYFKYGAMGSSKTAQALITKYNYEENDLRVWLLKPSADLRDGEHTLSSRIGLSAKADVLPPDRDAYAWFRQEHLGKCDVIIVDECQFLTVDQIDQLRAITDGLRTSLAAGEGIAAYARWMRKFDTTITELSGNLIFPLLMNSLADVSGVLWERCVTFWGPETVIEQETRITAMLAEGRGRDAALYIENIYHHYCDAHPNE